MENNVYGLLLENAELESRVLNKYVQVGITNENVKDFVVSKVGAATQAIKRIYEKIMTIITDLINKVLDFAATRKTNKAKNIWKDLEYFKTKVKGKKFNNIDKVLKADKKLWTVDKIDGIADIDEIKPEEILKLKVEGAYEKVTGAKASDLSKANLGKKIKEFFMPEGENEWELDETQFEAMKKFATGEETTEGSAGYLVLNLRHAKAEINKQYQEILKSIKKDFTNKVNDIKEATEDEPKNDNAAAKEQLQKVKKFRSEVAKASMEVNLITVGTLSDIVKQYINLVNVIGKTIGKSKKKKDKEDKKAANESFSYNSVMDDLTIMALESSFEL